ncbi:Protein nedd1 [Dissophora globulifera]|uniref:Protein nedd1 n=1 Tax=Dissophora globulifera TaxID=979702 RepID=A0A9P6RUH8_9FUNG|nr:Protein nedd1 [Dissophora globulifera]
MDASAQSRPFSQRKRSYSNTAYSSQEEEAASATATPPSSHNTHQGNHSHSAPSSAPSPPSVLAVATGSHVLTYDFINTGTMSKQQQQQSQQPPTAAPGQYEGIQMSHERTAFSVSNLKWSPDNTMLAVEAQDGRIGLHDSRGRFQESLVSEPVVEAPRAGSSRCAMSWAPKPQRLYFAKGNKVMTWDSSTRRTAETFEVASTISALAINSEDILLAVGQSIGNVDVINRATGVSARLETPSSLVMSRMEYSVFNKSILGGVGNDGILRLWNTGVNGSAASYHSFTTTHEVPISAMAFSPFNRYLICTAGLDKRYALYDVEKRNVVKNTVTDYGLTSVTFKNDGISMAFGTEDGKVLLYDLRSTSRPISIIETKVNAPVMAVHFQGKQQSGTGSASGSMKRHQASNGHGLKRHNSVGSNTSVFSKKDSITTATTAAGSAATTLISTAATAAAVSSLSTSGLGEDFNTAKSALTRPTPIKTATLSHPSLSQLAANETSYPTREVQSAGISSGKAIMDLFSKRNSDSTTSASATTLTRPKRPAAPSSITTGSSAGTTLSSKPTTPSTSGPSVSGSTPAGRSGYTSVPTTPAKETSYPSGGGGSGGGPSGSSYPNSRTVSPFAFQARQPRSPSEDGSTSSSSINTPPGSPSAAAASQSHLKHHHYVDLTSKSPSRVSRAKRRKSFGSLMASGGASSAPGTPGGLFNSYTDEKMEILRGQIVDQVRDVLLDHPMEEEPRGRGAATKVTTPGSAGMEGVAVISQTGMHRAGRGSSKARTPMRDLWMQVGQEGSGSTNRAGAGGDAFSSITKTPSGFLAQSALPALSSSSSPSVAAMAIESLQNTGIGSTSGMTSSSFPSKILEGVIEGCLMEFRAGIRSDIQNMHLELLRQFQIQKMEIEGLLKQYTDTKDLKEENERLLEENRRLRMNY